MFKNIFSFNGRIQRTEYAMTFVFYITAWLIIRTLSSQGGTNGLFGFLMIPVVYILWAQGAKRCHDIGKSGWWQIIPFYFLWLLFQKGDPSTNEYDIGYDISYGADDYEKPFNIDDNSVTANNDTTVSGHNSQTPIL